MLEPDESAFIIPDDLEFDSFSGLFSGPSYPFSDDCLIQDWSPSSGSTVDCGQALDNFNLDFDTLLNGDVCGDLFSVAVLAEDTSQDTVVSSNVKDVNNNNVDSVKEEGHHLDNTFEDMINDTFKTMMKSQTNGVVSKYEPNQGLSARMIPTIGKLIDPLQGPIASSSPKQAKLRPIQPKPLRIQQMFPCIQSRQCHPHTNPNLVQVVPPPSDHQYHMSPISHVAMEGIHPQASKVKIVPKKKFPLVAKPFPKVLLPGSFIWRGFHGGLQRNLAKKYAKRLSSFSAQPSFLKLHNQAQRFNPKASLQRSQLVRKGSSRPHKFVSVLKPIHRPSIFTKPPLNHWPKNADVDCVPNNLKVIKKENTEKPNIAVHNKITTVSPSGWVTREDPVKEKKNQLERERRWELAMYREKLKEMLPSTNDVDKVPTVNILGAAIDYCIEIQDELSNLEQSKLDEGRRKEILTWRLARLKYQQKIHNNNVLSQISLDM